MEPIINPWWVLFADTCDKLSIGAVFCTAILMIYLSLSLIYWIVEVERPPFFKKNTVIILTVLIFVFSIVPSKETIYTMITIDQITPDNIDTGKDVIDYVVEKIEQIVEENEDD